MQKWESVLYRTLVNSKTTVALSWKYAVNSDSRVCVRSALNSERIIVSASKWEKTVQLAAHELCLGRLVQTKTPHLLRLQCVLPLLMGTHTVDHHHHQAFSCAMEPSSRLWRPLHLPITRLRLASLPAHADTTLPCLCVKESLFCGWARMPLGQQWQHYRKWPLSSIRAPIRRTTLALPPSLAPGSLLPLLSLMLSFSF